MAYIQDWGMRVQAQPQINTTRRAFLHLSQNENGRMLNIRITDVNIPAGSTAVLAGTKPDGTVYSQAGTLSGNTATFAEDVQMTAVAGTWDAKITITNGGNCICTARITITIDPDTVAGGAVPSDSQLDGIIAECRAIADSVRKEAYGSPLVADAVEDMTDQSRVYVYTGSESGMTAGHWYYYNGSAWTDGGVYNAVAVDTDTTLTIAGKAADAKKVGDELADVKEDLTNKADKTELTKLTDGYYSPSASLYVQGGLNADGTINSTKYYASTPEFLVFDYPVVVKLVDDTNYTISKILIQNHDGTLVQITNQLANGACIDANMGFKIQIFKNGAYSNANLEEFSKQIVLETKTAYLAKVNNTNEGLMQKNGYKLLDMYFRRGSVTSGNYLGYVFYRVSTPYIVDITRTITIQVKTGFKIGVLTYDAEGTYLADSEWVTSRTVEAGSHIRIQIARVTENQSEYADVWEFYSALSAQTELKDYIDSVSGAMGSALNNPMFGCGRAKLNAHMGYHVNYPENSTKAYTEAGKLGYWGIEADVNKTSDGYYVMMHDTTVDRTTDGTGKINEMTLAQIRALHLNGDSTLTVPTFEEYLGICKHYGCIPMIEFKSTIPNTEAEYNTIIDIVEDFGFNENSVVFSGSKWALANFRKATDKYIYASIYQNGGGYSWDTEFNMNKAYKNTMMSWDIGLGLTAERVKQAHASGIPICAFITDTVASTESAFGVGADCCTTNVILPTD